MQILQELQSQKQLLEVQRNVIDDKLLIIDDMIEMAGRLDSDTVTPQPKKSTSSKASTPTKGSKKTTAPPPIT